LLKLSNKDLKQDYIVVIVHRNYVISISAIEITFSSRMGPTLALIRPSLETRG